MNNVVIVDFGHLFHLSRAIAIQAPPGHGLEDSIAYHIQGKLRTIERELRKRKIEGYETIFVEDRPALRKLDLLPSYKGDRKDLSHEKSAVKNILLEREVAGYWCSSEGNEADDTIATLASQARSGGRFTVIVTGDKDLWQLIDELTIVFNPIKKSVVTPEEVYKSFSVGPKHIALVKALWGDAGDCVPNVIPRQQKHLLPLILNSDGTLTSLHTLICASQTLDPKPRKMYEDQFANVQRNYELVKLDILCNLNWG